MDKTLKPISENIKNIRGLIPVVDPIKDLQMKSEYPGNSWFAIGHCQAEGHDFGYVYQLMTIPTDAGEMMMNYVLSITDETTGWYHGENRMFPISDIKFQQDYFSIETPDSKISGDLDVMHIEAAMPKGSISLELHGVGYILYNAGNGRFSAAGIDIYEYAIPHFITKGVISVEGKEYVVSGVSWFDRQWQGLPETAVSMQQVMGGFYWCWMDLNLDNGEVISLWNVGNTILHMETAWATILHEDGTHTVTTVEPLRKMATKYWKSPVSGFSYPNHWTIRIPAYDADMQVVTYPNNQELVSEYDSAQKFEGTSRVTGTYKGKNVTGFCYVEMLGNWE